VGFGSMPGLDPEGLAEMVVEALAQTGKRGLLATGGGAISAQTAARHVHVITGAPHEALFPLMDAVVHHGGAGTTAAAIRAGRPMAVCPFFGDQPFWGRRVESLGIAPPPLERKTLTADALANAIEAMNDARMREAAATLGNKVRAEDGVSAAVNFLEQVMSDA
jgi:UDP:flavonoid glycosyltransferase YjiC (YdhE family)